MNHFLKRYEEMGAMLDPKTRARPAIRINTIKAKDDDFLKEIPAVLEKVKFLDHGYFYKSQASLAGVPEHLLGLFYIQEAASQLCAEVLGPGPEEKVLDMCAAPGSKTTHMAMLMENKGAVVALDANLQRLTAVKNNIERLGITNVLAYKKDARFADDFGIEFDRVLLDAPCSGNFAADDEWFEKRDLEELGHVVKMQRQLLETGLAVLKKGGLMLYSTCSLEPEENEENISWFLDHHPEASLVRIDKDIGLPGLTEPLGKKLRDDIKMCKRIWPGETQGFFLALLKKN